MSDTEFLNGFEVLFNNITSNQAPGLNPYEISIFLTKAQDEILKNCFTPGSPGNTLKQGFDDSIKRQADFSSLMKTSKGKPYAGSLSPTAAGYIVKTESGGCIYENADRSKAKTVSAGEPLPSFRKGSVTKTWNDLYTGVYPISSKEAGVYTIVINGEVWGVDNYNGYSPSVGAIDKIDQRSHLFSFPDDVFIVINETFIINGESLQVKPLKFDEYSNFMSKPYKRPVKSQAWRLISNSQDTDRIVEIIAGPGTDNMEGVYTVRYIKRPKPVIVGDLDGLSINGYEYGDSSASNALTKYTKGCELDPIMHENILQRAVELAKLAWTANGQDNNQLVLQAGQRSE